MTIELSIKDSATWRSPFEIRVNDVGTWQQIVQVYVNTGGTWKLVTPYYSRLVIGSNGIYDGFATSVGVFGSLAFSESLAVYGTSLSFMNMIASRPGVADMELRIGQSVSNVNSITNLIVEDAAGSIRTYTAATASYSFVGGSGVWTWGSGASPVYNSGIVGQSRVFAIYLP